VEKYGATGQSTGDNVTGGMRNACSIAYATPTILIAFSLQQRLQERASILRLYVLYIAACLVIHVYVYVYVYVYIYVCYMPTYAQICSVN
jgi:hypothetical protein